MKNIYLRLWYILAFIVFFIAAPSVIFYTNGYIYNWQKKSIQLTGVLYLKSYPKGADIYLNGEKQGATPLQISHLIPGEYEVRIEKPGYQTWQKKLSVTSGYTTFAEDVTLFKSTPALKLLAPGSITKILNSRDQKNMAILANHNKQQILYIFKNDAKKAEPIKSYNPNEKIELVDWSASGQHLLIKKNNQLLNFALNSGQELIVPKISQLKIINWQWDYYNDNYIYGLNTLTKTSQQLVRLDVNSGQLTFIGPNTLLNFGLWQNKIFAINQKDDHLYLTEISTTEQKDILEIPKGKYIFKDIAGTYLALFDENNQAAYILKPDDTTKPLLTWFRTDGRMQWHNGGLLYLNQDELWIYYPESNQNILIERLSQPIDLAFWHPASATIITRQNSELKVYELDNRDHRVVTSLLKIDDPLLNPIVAQPKGDLLILSTTEAGQPGLYSVEIQ